MLQANTERSVVVERRFRGLPETVHGGYIAGILATALGGAAAEVRLRRPIPLERHLGLGRPAGALVELCDGGAILAEAAPAELPLDAPLPVTLAEAEAASKRYPGLGGHLFPDCLVCGPTRAAGDGLRIFPGPVAGRRLVAAPWTPPEELADDAGHVPAELVWAALDCPQLWSLIVHEPAGATDLAVLASLTTRLEHPVVAGEPHVLLAWPLGREGGRLRAGAALLAPGGELCAIGRQTAAITGGGVPLGRDRWRAALNENRRRDA